MNNYLKLVMLLLMFFFSTLAGCSAEGTKTVTVTEYDTKTIYETVTATTEGSQTATIASPATQSTPATPQSEAPQFGDGTLAVGTEIQPGTYRTKNESGECYYARLSGFGNSLDEIIANDNAVGPAVVTIAPTDKGFKSNRCDSWTQDLSPITASPTSFGDGMFIVNTDIQPGTYKNSGGASCYYARLAGFSGTLDDIIANENAEGPAIVTIDPADVGFKSSGCGVWNRM